MLRPRRGRRHRRCGVGTWRNKIIFKWLDEYNFSGSSCHHVSGGCLMFLKFKLKWLKSVELFIVSNKKINKIYSTNYNIVSQSENKSIRTACSCDIHFGTGCNNLVLLWSQNHNEANPSDRYQLVTGHCCLVLWLSSKLIFIEISFCVRDSHWAALMVN